MEAMARLIKEAPEDDKFLVISQWTSMLALCQLYLTELNVNNIIFEGSMKRSERDDAVKKFNESKKVKVS